MSGPENRLSDEDRERIGLRVLGTVREWRAEGYRLDRESRPTDLTALRRIAAHGIGCTAAALRDSELDEIDAICAQHYDAARYNAAPPYVASGPVR